MKDLTELRISGMWPFATYADTVDNSLSQAHAMLALIEAGFRAEHDLQHIPAGENIEVFRTLNHTIMADALDGVQSLVALAQYCREMDASERRAAPARAVAA